MRQTLADTERRVLELHAPGCSGCRASCRHCWSRDSRLPVLEAILEDHIRDALEMGADEAVVAMTKASATFDEEKACTAAATPRPQRTPA